MAKVLFINPVIRQSDKPTHIPYGMAQLVALAIKDGHKVQVLDANAWRPTDEEMRGAIMRDKWDVIAVGGLVTTYGFIKRIVALARDASRESHIIIGGGVITPIPFEVMTFLPEVDIGVIGEGYLTLSEILAMIDSGDSDWEKVKGMAYRGKDGRIKLTAQRPLLEELDSLPFPAWEMFPLDRYFKNSSILLSEEAMSAKRHIGIMASYGCLFRCKYCFHLGLSGEVEVKGEGDARNVSFSSSRKVRHHSPSYVVDMVKFVKKKFGVDFVSFLDENFSSLARKSEWFDEFERRWRKAGLSPSCAKKGKSHDPKTCKGIHWGTTAHVALVNEEILARFRKLGCAHLDYGLESFSDEILKSIGKGATARLNEKAVVMTMKAGIRPIPNQIIGFPEESFGSIRASVDAWERLGIRSLPFFATPYPGSEWYYEYKDRILDQYNGDLESFLLDLGDATKITAVISRRFSAVELLGLRELMVNRDLKRIGQYEAVRGSRD